MWIVSSHQVRRSVTLFVFFAIFVTLFVFFVICGHINTNAVRCTNRFISHSAAPGQNCQQYFISCVVLCPPPPPHMMVLGGHLIEEKHLWRSKLQPVFCMINWEATLLNTAWSPGHSPTELMNNRNPIQNGGPCEFSAAIVQRSGAIPGTVPGNNPKYQVKIQWYSY